MKVYLIRHGATPGNLEKRYVGTTDEPLDKEAVTTLKKLRVRYPVPVQVVTSPLKRCMQTASLLFPGIPSECCEGLKECDFGRFEYHNYMELSRDPEYQRWIDSNGTLPFPGGESQKRFQERCCQAFLKSVAALRQAGCASVAYVVHGGTIMALMERFCTEEKPYFDWQVKNQEGFACKIQGTARVAADTRFLQMEERLPVPEERLHKSGIEEVFVVQKNERLQCGYTTGSCAAAAATAAARMLFTGNICRDVRLMTPKGIALDLEIVQPVIGKARASCAVRKFGGDDPDATDGLLIFAEAKRVPGRKTADVRQKSAGDLPDAGAKAVPDLPDKAVGPVPELSDKAVGPAPDLPDKAVGPAPELSDKAVGPAPELSDKAVGLAPELSDKAVRSVPDLSGAAAKPVQETTGMEEATVLIDGGTGVGRVTKPGLEQPVGAAAINRIPRQMITQNVRQVCAEFGYTGVVQITISVQGGEEAAKRTFNPHLGILGGISILGTSGIVVPMSEQALVDSIRIEMRQKVKNGERYLLITPGNYGADFLKGQKQYGLLRPEYSMKCSNYVGETLDMALQLGVKAILFVSHIGKFIKVSGGIMNTHSAHADCRAELMAAQAMRAGASADTVKRLLATNTTEEAVGILKETGDLDGAVSEAIRRIQFYLQKHVGGELRTEAVLFSNQYGYLGESEGAEALMELVAAEKEEIYGESSHFS